MMDVNDLISAAVQLFNEKKYAEAIEILHQAWDGITDKNTQIPEQIKIQNRLGGCYLEQAINAKDTDKADGLFEQAVWHFQELLQLTKQLEDEQNKIEEQIIAQFRLSFCYLKHAQKTKDTDKADKLFGHAVEYSRKRLELTKQLKDGQDKIHKQIVAQFRLGSCYFEQAKKTKDTNKADKRFGQAVEDFKKELELTEQLEDKQAKIQYQILAQYELGTCYLEQAQKTKDTDKANKLFEKAVEHLRELLKLTKQLTDKQDRIQQQIYAQSGLGGCYIEQIKRSKSTSEAEIFVKQASENFLAAYEQLPQLSDEKEKKVWEKIIRLGLREIDYLNEDWNSYFEKKKQEIQESLFKEETSQSQDAVATVLAVLHITPIELGFTPMAHYTSPHVCHILFGIGGNETARPMRLRGSSPI